MLKNSPTEDFPAWYQEVISKAQLSENGPVRGTIVIRPYGYAIWELMQVEMDRMIKAAGAQNAYFPLFIPESYLAREAEHVDGFSPELAVVTHAGGSKLEEPLVVRPTSETIIGESMAKWVNSYRDLPLLLNQWANVVRWEKRPRAFLRTTEFLWQEGHTAHVDETDAARYSRAILENVYKKFLNDVLAIPVIVGQKSPSERFAGAINTMTCEGMMGDGKALQLATSHELGTNFSNAFGIDYTDHSGNRQPAWTTSWGSSTRMMGGLFMTHGDERGLRLPPAVAPYQVVVVQISESDQADSICGTVERELLNAGLRVKVDRDHRRSVGARLTDWEIKGVPVRVDVGEREVKAGAVTVVRRDTMEKLPTPISGAAERILSLLKEIQSELHRQASSRLESRTLRVETIRDAVEQARVGFAEIEWRKVVGAGGEGALNENAVSVRCLRNANGAVPERDQLEGAVAIIGRSY